jgi:HEAT repeat protein/RNA polymerase subunit RPABC4/transcription elongation factor Spt4
MGKTDMSKFKRELASDKSEVRKNAMTVLRAMPAAEALPILSELLDKKNDDLLNDVSKAMLSYKDDALPYLARALTSDSWSIRRGASVVLARLGAANFNKLMNMVPENEEDVDYWMVQTLSNMGVEATQYLTKLFKHSNVKVRLAAIRASQNIEDPVMVEQLLRLLDEQSWPIRKAAFDSLEDIYTCNLEAVVKALDKSSEEARFWVIKLLAQESNPEFIQRFEHIVESSPMESKLEAIKALAMIESPEAHKLLVGYLANKSWIIRKTAADAIWEQGLGVSDDLLSAIRGSNVDARYWSVKLLGRSKEPQIFEEIVKCLQDPQISVRVAASQALGSLNDKRGLAPLMTMLNDESEDVRTAAILSLSQLGEREVETSKAGLPSHIRQENMMACPSCSKMVGRSFTFCPFCLSALKPLSCRGCGSPMQAGWKGCPHCGTPTT